MMGVWILFAFQDLFDRGEFPWIETGGDFFADDCLGMLENGRGFWAQPLGRVDISVRRDDGR